MTVQEIQRGLTPKDDLTPYTGQWVALREGHVIAHDIDGVTLRNHPEVESSDVLMPVGDPGKHHYIL